MLAMEFPQSNIAAAVAKDSRAAHHLDHDIANNSMGNSVLLCKSCRAKGGLRLF
jgi:hypothetical protein